MFQKYIAALLLMTVLLSASPVFAGDLVSPKLLPNRLSAFSFVPPQGQTQTPAAPVPYKSHWSKKGKILTVAGLGVAALGAFMATRQDQDLGTSFENGQLVRKTLRMKVVGGSVIGLGAVMAGVGLTRKD